MEGYRQAAGVLNRRYMAEVLPPRGFEGRRRSLIHPLTTRPARAWIGPTLSVNFQSPTTVPAALIAFSTAC